MVKAAKPAPVSLPAAKVAAWRLARQRLAGKPAKDPETVARDLVGVQAQVLSSAALSIALRTGGQIEATSKGLAKRRLLRLWAHRGTLHIFAADDVPTIVAVRRPMEPWRRPAWLRYFGVNEAQMEQAIEAVGEILDDGAARTRAELAAVMEAEHGKAFAELVRGSWGSFLKQAGNRGYVAQAWTGDSSVAFVRPDRWLKQWRVVDPAEATREVVLRYFAAYGPATPGELNRWAGLIGRGLKPVLLDIADELTEVEVDGERGLVRTSDLPEIEAARPLPDGGVRLLGPFDPFIVGAGLRGRLIPPAHLSRVSRTAGWISPVVLIDGSVGGVWTSTHDGHRLRITVDPFGRPTAKLRSAIAKAAERVAEVQGADPIVEFGRVFATGHESDDA
jgi:Winged helix DNA-binding domain